MPSIVYSDQKEAYTGGKVDYYKLNATKHYLNHYANYLLLDFIRRSTNDRLERLQALKELSLCEKKMEYWRHHPNFDQAQAAEGVLALKGTWNR